MSNEEQIRHWNTVAGPRWLALQSRLDEQLDPLGLAAMEGLGALDRQRVLDVGCGCGSTSLALADRVGPGGDVTGVDISAPMLSRARERAAGRVNVRFVEADAQRHVFHERSLDTVFSRFGVMFFDDPAGAFENLARALTPGGRLGFVCWRAMRENQWVRVPMEAALKHISPPPPAAPDAPGPFSLADRDRLDALLKGAGFADVSIVAYDAPLRFGGAGDFDATVDFATQIGPTATMLRDVEPATVERVKGSLRDALSAHRTAEGVLLDGAMWHVYARRA